MASEYVFVSYTHDSATVEMSLVPVHLRIRQATVAAIALGTPAPSVTPSIADEITKLVNLRDSGVLTNDEFTAAKARVLSGM